MKSLVENIDKLHTTQRGVVRIKRNLELESDDILSWCKKQILSKDATLKKRGKNLYVHLPHCKLTIHSTSYTIITAYKKN
ncbi:MULTISPECIES: DUF3781 domain-containing protein [Helicobacter]|uniref:DUF3781 domain-containing protein n=1 Tax=Helicobacter TaxID=209 RepID=UPI002604AEEE|nr:DUF3781 domain-containing protein [Helicobacter sp. UBA3407]